MIKSLTLSSFRNHLNKKFVFSPKTNLIVGPNAVGKSNILEAIWLLATGESFRAGKIEEMVSWGEEVGHVVGRINNSSEKSKLEIRNLNNDVEELMVTVTRGMIQGKRVQKRLYKINGVGRRKKELIGMMPAVLFRPEDMDLVSGEPSLRRGFLDDVLIQISHEYQRSLESYQKGLRQRNRLLDQIRDGGVSRTTLIFWDQLLIKEGTVVSNHRRELVDKINETISVFASLKLDYSPSIISPARLAAHAEAEISLGYTLVGPHKDDFNILDKKRDLAIYGSRGEQRMAVLWLKEAQLLVIEKGIGDRPLLLLDDILSELDHHHVEQVVRLCTKQQTILTTTDEGLSDYFGNGNKIIRLG